MENRKYLDLDELYVWSDNPRHGFQVEGEAEFDEETIINILIDVVGADKMYNLIADIFARKRLMGNVNPVVVFNNGKYYVYDGNRRVSALKILKNPMIVEDEQLRNKIIKLIGDEDVSFADRVFVYITNEEEALEIMDNAHIGEQAGVGVISWEPYQRDLSLNRRGKNVVYPYSFQVAQALSYNMKSFKNISYTDLDRLFGSKPLREFFSIKETDDDYPTKASYIVGMLLKYKEALGFRAFSRQFNLSGSTEDNAPIIKFCNWVKIQEQNRRNFYLKTIPVEVFEDEKYSFDMLQLKIYDAKNTEIKYTDDEIEVKYFSPNGIESTEIDMTETGDWKISIVYRGEKHTETISVKKLLPPKIDFNSKTLFGQGNTIDLRELIIRATDGHGNDRKDDVTISAVGDAIIIHDTFAPDNPIGTYHVAYAFQDVTGAPYSITKEIRIIDQSNPLLAENRNIPLLSFNGKCTIIDISDVVNKLVLEINSLDFEENICIIATALRALIELSFDALHTSGKLVFSTKSDLEKCIEEFKSFLLDGELSRICTKYSVDLPSFRNEENCVKLIDPKFLSTYLNIASHKSTARIDITKVAEAARKAISPILVYTSFILK